VEFCTCSGSGPTSLKPFVRTADSLVPKRSRCLFADDVLEHLRGIEVAVVFFQFAISRSNSFLQVQAVGTAWLYTIESAPSKDCLNRSSVAISGS